MTLGIVLGTGPSLTDCAEQIRRLKAEGALVFGVNRTFEDFDIDVLICCDPAFHAHYGKIEGNFDHWHWDRKICDWYGYRYIEGVWLVEGVAYPREVYETPPGPCGGLWVEDKTKISLNHCSAAQALNLAVHYDCEPILLVGHDFRYDPGKPRHYFRYLSAEAGEYPEPLRKHSEFDKKGKGDDLLQVYRRIANQRGLPRIVNCTPGSSLPWFEFGQLEDFTAMEGTR